MSQLLPTLTRPCTSQLFDPPSSPICDEITSTGPFVHRSMSKRPPNEVESRLHQAALSAPKQEITAKQAEAIIPEGSARQNALNFLLGVGLFKSLKDARGNLSFRAVSKGELVATRDLSGEENLVLGHIKNFGNEGIWTKHLKAKTNLHQTVIDRCLKTLIQKRLIKRVPSVQHPTRKIYMLEGLEPSIALTGGPWYTDNELDTEFIQHLMDACYKFIYDISFPKRREGQEGALFPISNAPRYPSAQNIRNSLRKIRITETELSVEHVEALLNVLVLDGKIEALPAFGGSLWDSSAINESDDESERRSRKKRKHDSEDSEDEKKRSKRKRKKGKSKDDSSDDEDLSSKKSRRKRDQNSGSDSESDVKRKKKTSKAVSEESDSSDSDSDARRKSKKRKKRSRNVSDDDSSSDSESNSRRNRSSKKSSKRSPSPFDPASFDGFDSGGGLVYRALKEQAPSLGLAQAPCALCPSFDFCKEGGPVNPQECAYYDDWLTSKTMAAHSLVDI